jgi:Anti-sigma factor NepR
MPAKVKFSSRQSDVPRQSFEGIQMVRGKASVQLSDPAGGHLTPSRPDRPQTRHMTGEPEPDDKQRGSEAKAELAEHIVGQLRLAYDELLNAPIPDHLQRLLAALGKAGGKS